MITSDPSAFLRRFRELEQLPLPGPYTMARAMMVDPTGFRISRQSAQDNFYMDTSEDLDLALARHQHEQVVKKITELGVEVIVFPGVKGFEDGIYPNNAFATTPGKLIIGHMFHPVRQQETKRDDIIEYFEKQRGYEVVDLSHQPGIAELTGVLIIDHKLGIGYCGLTNRCDRRGCENMHKAFGLRMTFEFALSEGEYHTNIVMACLAGKAAVLYASGIENPEAANAIKEAYGERLALLNDAEKAHFMGNCLAITPTDILFSATAQPVIQDSTREVLARQGLTLHFADVSELEKGGGSLRCLIAEIF